MNYHPQKTVLAAAAALLMLLAIPLTDMRAQTSGPVQPDFSVPAVGSGPGVSPFTGGFTFGLPVMTVPGPDGSGYSVSLSYRAGTNPDGEVSWVGYGWSLNAGAIVRDVRGYPDDWKDTVTVWNKGPQQWTVSGAVRVGTEISSAELGDTANPVRKLAGGDSVLKARLSLGYTTVYSSVSGFRRANSYGLEWKGVGSLDYDIKDGDGSWSARANPGLLFNATTLVFPLRQALSKLSLAGELLAHSLGRAVTEFSNSAARDNTPELTMPWRSARFDTRSFNAGLGLTATLNAGFVSGADGGVNGNVTIRTPVEKYAVRGVGYMYSQQAGASEFMDYSFERAKEYRTTDNFLPIPFTNADRFNVTGGAPVGSIRLYARSTGTFRPDYVHNVFLIPNIDPEGTVGARWGVGAALGVGRNSLTVSQWQADTSSTPHSFDSLVADDRTFMRYRGDMGGNLLAAASDDAESATVSDSNHLRVPSSIYPMLNGGERVGRNLYVGYNLNKEMASATGAGVPYLAYDKTADAGNVPNRDRTLATVRDQIGEISVTDAGGWRSNYSLPVYSRSERRLGFGVHRAVTDTTTNLRGERLVYADVDTTNALTLQGQELDAPTATAYLLTSITSPDYQDITGDGPSADDLGAWVRFRYQPAAAFLGRAGHDINGTAFHWRTPYNGLAYARGEMSDPDDDQGAVSMGEREQYYLASIETKTHIAYFITNMSDVALSNGGRSTGSFEQRMDAYQAPFVFDTLVRADYLRQANGDSTATYAHWYTDESSQQVPAPNLSRRLERVELYAKNAAGEADSLLSTTFLEYDYSLRRGMPNSVTPHPDSTARLGMLTLKRVWSQAQRVYNARISPYEFGYEYRRTADYPAAMRTKYPAITGFADSLSSAEQNPPYTPYDADGWGGHAYNGAARSAAMRPWVDQHPDTNAFDPAAWQLKYVKSPTGAEMHVQYEANDYCYVQDRPAMAMASLRATFGDSLSNDGDNSGRYYVNLADLGVADTDRAAVQRYYSLAKRQFVDTNERLYLKFLYALVGDSAKFDDPEYNSEYITAYARVNELRVDSAVISGTMRYALCVKLGMGGDSTVPKRVCHDLVQWRKRGRLQPGHPVDPRGVAGGGAGGGGTSAIFDVIGHYFTAGYEESEHCRAVDYAHSYLRLPMVAAKRGGGVRVRRLLTLDPGVEADSMLYGGEYIYQTYDPARGEYISSGVAANEPTAAREENALVNVELAHGRIADTKIIAGDHLDQYEGPLGESLLPGASVGYARVVTRNIHTGKTAAGFGVQEFFTARDFPMQRYDTALAGYTVAATGISGPKHGTSPLWGALAGAMPGAKFPLDAAGGSIGVGLGFSRRVNDLRLAQGYRFVLNEMNGAAKSSAAYGGRLEDPATWTLTSLSQYEYFKPGEKLPVLDAVGDTVRYDNIGKEMEVTMDARSIEDHTIDVQVNGDVTFAAGSITDPQITSSAVLSTADNDLRTHVTTKVISYPATVKRVLTYGDGIYHVAENVAFDPTTGSPIITRTNDSYDRLALEKSPLGHNGAYTSYGFRAGNEYPLLGQKAANQRAVIDSAGGITITKTHLGSGNARLDITPATNAATYAALARLNPGDLLHLTTQSSGAEAGFYHVASKSGTTVNLHKVSANYAPSNTTAGAVALLVVESGLANQIGGAAGGIVTYGETESAVLSAANFATANPSSFTARQALADTLNAVVARGGGFVFPATVSGLGAIIRVAGSLGDSCGALADTIWLARRDGRLVLTRGRFSTTLTINGTPTNPHRMVTHLNAYLDSLWGYHIDTALGYNTQCDSTNYIYRHYTSQPAGYAALIDSMMAARFDTVNYLDNYWIGDLISIGGGMDTLVEGFRRGTNTYYSASGQIDLHGVLAAHTVRSRLWASECSGADKVKKVSMYHQQTLETNPADTTIVRTGLTLAQLNAYFPYTTQIGAFAENNQGYLTYKNFVAGSTIAKAFGIRFAHGDTVCS